MNPLIEGEDFYWNEQGFMVLTAHYLLQRGFCCGNGCKHCPYDYAAVEEPRRSQLLAQRISHGNNSEKNQNG